MKSANPHSGIYEAETSRTLEAMVVTLNATRAALPWWKVTPSKGR